MHTRTRPPPPQEAAAASGDPEPLLASAAANEWPERAAPALLADARRRGPSCFDAVFYIRSSMYDLGFMLQVWLGARLDGRVARPGASRAHPDPPAGLSPHRHPRPHARPHAPARHHPRHQSLLRRSPTARRRRGSSSCEWGCMRDGHIAGHASAGQRTAPPAAAPKR